jgi:hypothetical protein
MGVLEGFDRTYRINDIERYLGRRWCSKVESYHEELRIIKLLLAWDDMVIDVDEYGPTTRR